MRDYYAEQDASRPAANQASYLKPYLGFRARLSQIVLNKWTILLLLVLIRLLFAIAGTDDSLSSARREALSACTGVERVGSAMASMPHYMAQGVNDMTASGIEKSVHALFSMLEMTVTGVEEIVLFVIHMMTSTYLCLITLAIRGSLGAAGEVGTAIADKLNETIDEVTGDIGDATKSITDAINKIFDKISNIPLVDGFEAPTINLDDEIKKLKELEVPPAIQENLQKLNQSIPTFEEVQNFTDSLIRIPFEKVKELIQAKNDYEFDRAMLPVPAKEQLDFCSDGNSINEFFDDLHDAGQMTKKIAIAVLIVAAILVCVPMAWREIRRYRQMEEAVQLLDKGHDGMDVVYIASRPHSSQWGMWMSRRFGSERRQAIVRWAWAYATSLPMLFVLALGIAGLFSCFCQWLLLRAIQEKVPELTNQVAGFADKVVTSLNDASMSWSNGVNGAMGQMDAEINEEIFGWVNETTSAVNGTLNGFVEKMSEALDSTFGGTPLDRPIRDVLNCLIGLKIASFQRGLTWVQEHAHVTFPTVANDTFSLGALAKVDDSDSSAELLADPSGKARDEISGAILRVIDKIIQGIIFEALISMGLILLWLVFALGGFLYASYYLMRRDNAYATRDPYIVNPALMDNNAAEKQYPDTAAPPYEYHAKTTEPATYPVNHAAPYTLPQGRTFPTYGPGAEASPVSPAENYGQINSHVVAESSRPGHLRSSSHGQVAEPSPLDEKRNPFLSPTDERRGPFTR